MTASGALRATVAMAECVDILLLLVCEHEDKRWIKAGVAYFYSGPVLYIGLKVGYILASLTNTLHSVLTLANISCLGQAWLHRLEATQSANHNTGIEHFS
jgi:hypothetical protein